MLSWLFFIIGSICLFLVVYPYIFYPIILYILPRKHGFNFVGSEASDFKIALVFCAYNEENDLPEKLENIRKLKQVWPELEVLAYSDASTDRSNEILEKAADILTPVISDERMGKVLGMQRLVAMTDSDIVIFTDANVLLEPESLPRLVQYFLDPEIGCVSGKLLYKNLDSAAAKVGGLYWRLEEKIKQLETETGSMMGADGAMFARRRKAYPKIPANLVDDMAVSMASIFDGQRCISASDVIVYEKAVSSSTEEFRRKKRIACGSYSTYLYQRDQLKKMSLTNRFKYISHKLMRWWGALFIVLTVAGFLLWGVSMGIGLPLVIALLAGIGIIIILGKSGIPGFSQVYEILNAIFATGIGVMESIKGGDYQIWETAKTR